MEDDVTKTLTEDARSDRSFVISELAETEAKYDRKIHALTKRVARLERHNFLPAVDDETRALMLGLGLLLLVQVAPILLERLFKWGQHSASSSS